MGITNGNDRQRSRRKFLALFSGLAATILFALKSLPDIAGQHVSLRGSTQKIVGNLHVTRNLVVGSAGEYGDIMPDIDAMGNIGSDTLRWKRVRAIEVVSGDIGFEDPVCAICGRQFEVGDTLALKIIKRKSDYWSCVPVHVSCDSKERRVVG